MNPLIRRLCTDVPFIADGALAALLQPRNLEIQDAEHPFYKRLRDQVKPQMTLRDDGTAIVPVEGTLARKPDVFELFNGVEDSSHVLDMVESAARNPDVRGILLDIDSPGGFHTGGPEIADAVKQAEKA